MELVLILVFLGGYLLISLEHPLKIDKSAVALFTACLLWVFVALQPGFHDKIHEILSENIAPIAEIVFFLLGAMTIVEIIDSHEGFSIITDRITTRNKRLLLIILSLITFFLSAVLDNLTTTIVMAAVMLKLITEKKDKVIFTGMIVIAANSGGAFSPIGDITTTMLWIGGEITPLVIITKIFLPSLVSLALPLGLALFMTKGNIGEKPEEREKSEDLYQVKRWEKILVLSSGILLLVSVPVFKLATGLPPFMGILGALCLLWFLTEILQRKRNHSGIQHLSAAKALSEIDLPSILFFIGILLSVSALEVGGVLHGLAVQLTGLFANINFIPVILGFLSSVFDNVPLVAASIQMYPLSAVPADANFWLLLAYTSGVGGSMLIIGSAAGVTAMGSTKVSFGEYAKKIGPLALAGYLAGIGVFILQNGF